MYRNAFDAFLMFLGSLAIAALTTPSAAADPDLRPGFPVEVPHFGGVYKSGPGVHTLIGNINGDSDLEILGSSGASGPVYAVKSDGTFVPGWPIYNGLEMGYLTLGRLSPNANADQVFVGFWGRVLGAYDGNGNSLPGWPRGADNYVTSPAALADIDGDGIDEIFIGEEDLRIHGYRADGTPLPGWPSQYADVGGQSMFTPAVADLDGDGLSEIITATGYSTGGVGIVAYHLNGTPVTGFPVHLAQGYVTTYVAVGDVDGDGMLEILAISKDSVYPYQPILNILRADGTVKRLIRLAFDYGNGTAPTLADLDGDMIPEIVLQASSAIEVYKGDGTTFPGWPRVIGYEKGNSAPVVGDVDGDGQPDIVVTASSTVSAVDSWLFVLDRVGNLNPKFPKYVPAGGSAVPAIADLDHDGQNEIIVTGNPLTGIAGYYDTVWVYGLGGGPHGRVEWGQFAGGAKHSGRYVSPSAAAAPVADLSLQVSTSVANPVVGIAFTFNMEITNKGPSTAARTTLSHVLPRDLSFVSASTGCVLRDITVICELGDLSSGVATAVQVTVVPQGGGSRTTRTVVMSDATDSASADNEVRSDLNVILLPVADLGVTQTDSKDPIRAGEVLTYHIVVTNAGPEIAPSTKVRDTIGDAAFASADPGCSYDNAQTVTCELGTVSSGETRTLSISLVPRTRRSTLTNTVTVSALANDPNGANNSVTEVTSVK